MQVTLNLNPAAFWRGFTLRELHVLKESLVREIVAREKILEALRDTRKGEKP